MSNSVRPAWDEKEWDRVRRFNAQPVAPDAPERARTDVVSSFDEYDTADDRLATMSPRQRQRVLAAGAAADAARGPRPDVQMVHHQ